MCILLYFEFTYRWDYMFRSSIFNYYTIVNGKSVIFNSMNEKIVRFNQKDVSSEEKLLDFFAVSSEKNRRLLIEQGLIVKCDANEEQIASIKLLDRVVNNDLYLTIMPTYGCNFRCIYCYENQCDSRTDNFPSISMGDDVQASIIRYVKKKLSEHYCLVVEWHGGEPLLRTDIIDSLSQIADFPYFISHCQAPLQVSKRTIALLHAGRCHLLYHLIFYRYAFKSSVSLSSLTSASSKLVPLTPK